MANLPYFDGILRQQQFLAGDTYSLADITLFAAITFARPIGLPVSDELTGIAAWFERFSALPAVKYLSGQSFR